MFDITNSIFVGKISMFHAEIHMFEPFLMVNHVKTHISPAVHPTTSTFRRLLRLSRSAALGSKAAAASPSLLSRRSAAWPLQRLTYAVDTGGDRGLQGEATRKIPLENADVTRKHVDFLIPSDLDLFMIAKLTEINLVSRVTGAYI
jgi:hypothetical protein